MHTTRHLVAGISIVMLLAITMSAQNGPQGPQPGPGGAAPAAAAGSDNVQDLIKATDQEWRVINPRLQAVVRTRQVVLTYTATNAGGRGGPPASDTFEGPGNGVGGGRANGAGGPAGPGGAGGRGGGGQFGGQGGGPGGPNPGGRGGNGGPGGGGAANNFVSTALADLKTAIADATGTPEQVKVKLDAVRSARQKAVATLAAAQKDLILLLTADQEATLVSMGLLD
ncbi:MAG: hypothetical protein ABI818_07560 [Acidobacteriota bacterium]